ncbi:YbbR-like domain-containing protein [soil metagenome]
MVNHFKNIIAWVSGLFASSTRENWQIVFLCIVAATTFWFFNALNNTYTTRLNYPIEFIYDGEGVVVVERLPSRITLDVSGGGWNLLRRTLWFSINPLKIRLDNPTERKYILGASLQTIISEQISEINLNYILTDTLPINIERKITKKVAVKVDSANISLGESHRITSPVTTTPDSIEVEGPSSLIDTFSDKIVLPVPKQEIVQNYKADITVKPDNTSNLLSVRPENVVVNFDVSAYTYQEKLVQLEKLNFPADSSLLIKDDGVIVSFHVDEKNLERVPDAKFKIAVNLRRMDPEDSTLTPVIVQHPDYVFDLSVEPSKIRVIHEEQNL